MSGPQIMSYADPVGVWVCPVVGSVKKGSLLQSLPFTKAVLHKICTVTERVQIKYLEVYTCLIDSRWSVERSTFPVNLTSDRKYFTASISNVEKRDRLHNISLKSK